MYDPEYANRYNTPDDIHLRIMPITARWKKGFEAARRASLDSDGKYPSEKTGSAIFHGARLLAVGNNLYHKTLPANVKKGQYIVTLHAEQQAVNRIRHRELKTKLICYVVRMNNFGDLVVSKPCNMCIAYLQKYGVSVVRFINSDLLAEEMSL